MRRARHKASYIDGHKCFLSPEKSINIQEELGVDIAMVLDECPSAVLSHEAIEKSLEMTLRWAKRSLEARQNPETAIWGITQGACFKDLRTRAAECLSAMDFDGMAIGGLSVGEEKSLMYLYSCCLNKESNVVELKLFFSLFIKFWNNTLSLVLLGSFGITYT